MKKVELLKKFIISEINDLNLNPKIQIDIINEKKLYGYEIDAWGTKYVLNILLTDNFPVEKIVLNIMDVENETLVASWFDSSNMSLETIKLEIKKLIQDFLSENLTIEKINKK